MNKICEVCHKKYFIRDCRWKTQIIKVAFCSKACKKTKKYKKLKDNYLLKTRGFPSGYKTKESYDNRFIPKEVICEHCNKKFKEKHQNQRFCSSRCSNSSSARSRKISESWKVKDDIESIKKKRKRTCLKKYGVENPMQVKDIQNKAKQTCMEKYGVENPFQDKELVRQGVQKKYGVDNYFQRVDLMKKHYMDSFGVDNPSKVENIKRKSFDTVKKKYKDLIGGVPAAACKKTNLEKYGNEYFFGSERGKMTYENLKNNYGWSAEEIKNLHYRRVNNNVIAGKASKESLKYFMPLYKKFRKLGIPRNNIYIGVGNNKEKYLDGYLYDFCVDDYKIIIEYNGIAFHPHKDKMTKNEIEEWKQVFTNKTFKETVEHDQEKINVAKQNGYHIIEIWSDNSVEENWQIINDLLSRVGVVEYAN